MKAFHCMEYKVSSPTTRYCQQDALCAWLLPHVWWVPGGSILLGLWVLWRYIKLSSLLTLKHKISSNSFLRSFTRLFITRDMIVTGIVWKANYKTYALSLCIIALRFFPLYIRYCLHNKLIVAKHRQLISVELALTVYIQYISFMYKSQVILYLVLLVLTRNLNKLGCCIIWILCQSK